MNKNGFTLVELIITIGLLAILGTMIASNMIGVQGRQMQANYESYKEQIAEAACLVMDSKYINDPTVDLVYSSIGTGNVLSTPVHSKSTCLGSICYVNTKGLIEYGFLDKDLENPATGFSVSKNEVVKIEYVSGVKTCTYIS